MMDSMWEGRTREINLSHIKVAAITFIHICLTILLVCCMFAHICVFFSFIGNFNASFSPVHRFQLHVKLLNHKKVCMLLY